jgi:NADP-dependent 3-hydroxy acid dehydrogenase YdfG
MTKNRFTGKVLVITGGAGGLGAAIALEAGLQGGAIAILDTNKAAIELLVANLRSQGITADGRVVDVRDGNAVTNVISELADSLSGIDILISAAGGSLGTPRDLDDIWY